MTAYSKASQNSSPTKKEQNQYTNKVKIEYNSYILKCSELVFDFFFIFKIYDCAFFVCCCCCFPCVFFPFRFGNSSISINPPSECLWQMYRLIERIGKKSNESVSTRSRTEQFKLYCDGAIGQIIFAWMEISMDVAEGDTNKNACSCMR